MQYSSSTPSLSSFSTIFISFEQRIYSLVLDDTTSQKEFSSLISSLFLPSDLQIIGFHDEDNNFFTISSILSNISFFNNKKIFLISSLISPDNEENNEEIYDNTEEMNEKNQNLPTNQILSNSESFLTESHALKAFQCLDLNHDGYVHKEEFISSLTQAFDCLLQEDIALGWAYSCLSSKDLALSTASIVYNLSTKTTSSSSVYFSSTYYLDFTTFCSWYLSIGFDPLREIFLRAMASYCLKTAHVSLLPQKLSSSSSFNLTFKSQQTKEISDLKMFEFFLQLRDYFLLINEENLIWWIKKLSKLGRPSQYISFSKFFMIIYDLLLQLVFEEESDDKNYNNDIKNDENHHIKYENKLKKLKLKELYTQNELKNDIYYLFDKISSILSPSQSQSPIQLGYILSIFLFACSTQSYTIYSTLFSSYSIDQNSVLVGDHILYTHFYMLFSLILHFYSPITLESSPDILIANPEYLSHAIYLKLLLSIEIKRKERGQLDLNEFIELFIHGLRIGLDLLEISSGYFYELFHSMIGIENFTGLDASFEAELSFDSPNTKNFKRKFESYQGSSLINYEKEFQNDSIEDNNELDNFSDSNEGSSPRSYLKSPCDSFEEDQIKSITVSYNGSSIALDEIQQYIGISNYNIETIFKEMFNLSLNGQNEEIMINNFSFVRYILHLISAKYIDLNVLERSKADFILDRLGIECESYGNINQKVNPQNKLLLDVFLSTLFLFDEPDGVYGEVLLKFLPFLINDKSFLNLNYVFYILKKLFFLTYYLNPSSTFQIASLKASFESKKFFSQFCLNLWHFKEDETKLYINNCNEITVETFTYLIDFTLKYLNEESNRFKLDDEQSDYVINESLKDLYYIKEEVNKDNIDYSSSDDENNIFTHFKNDKLYPPSSLVLELREVSNLLGFNSHNSDDLLDHLGEYCQAGYLTRDNWIAYISTVLPHSSLFDFPVDDSILLSNDFTLFSNNLNKAYKLSLNIFDTFASESGGHDAISFDVLTCALSFLCTNSPIEDRLLVSFTIIDSDRDNSITYTELVLMFKSILTLVNIVSESASKIIERFRTSVSSLAQIASQEAMSSMGLKIQIDDENDDNEDNLIYYEMFNEVIEEFFKLSSMFT